MFDKFAIRPLRGGGLKAGPLWQKSFLGEYGLSGRTTSGVNFFVASLNKMLFFCRILWIFGCKRSSCLCDTLGKHEHMYVYVPPLYPCAC